MNFFYYAWYALFTVYVLFTDALGLGSFISIGMDKAFVYTDNIIIIILCGYITAIGGGILASERPIDKIFQNSKTVVYHILTISCCCMYYFTKSEIGLIIVTTILILFSNLDASDVCNIILFSVIRYKPYKKVYIYNQEDIYYNTIMQRCYIERFYTKKCLPLNSSKRYLVFRKIRQC